MLIVIVVLVVVMVALVVASGVLTYNHGTVDLRIDTDQSITVHVSMYVDGVLRESFDLPPGYFFENNYTVSFPNDSKLITVEAISTGGTIGATSDSMQVTILKDRAAKVDLRV